MKIGEIYHFEDTNHFKGWVIFNEINISLLENEVKRIRNTFEIIKKQSGSEE